ncbi:hypothetical protein HOLleu_05088 [Holothuria leucospilota]|uniref:Uncharacterized protein n=1 Tax=Holothuria leucospilota TaxID=206669 RepID=A0A9Q1HH66_HOLLE|nr:hypothetical protein HOLleu_05088 [Holothuria leucospilota]
MQVLEMTSLLKELIILILVSRIIPVVLDRGSESEESEDRAKGQGRNIRGRSRKFFQIHGDELVFQPQHQHGCAKFLRKVQKIIGQSSTIHIRDVGTFNLSNVDCSQQRCEIKPRRQLCGSNKKDKTSLRIFKNACHQCAEGCKQVKKGSNPFERVKNAFIVNGNCYNYPPVLVREEPDTVFCSRPNSDHSCSLRCSDLQLPLSGPQDLPHLPNFRSSCAEGHNR